jgi:tetratricopeptide (TPR) repeat protein
VVADWVASEAGDGFELVDTRQIRVKGKSMPIPVHTLGGLRGESDHFVVDARRPKVVGRDAERRTAHSVAARARSGSPRLLVVHGDAGVGGSALVSEVAFDLAQLGWTSFRGRCQQHLRDAPFGVLIPLFERLLGLTDDMAVPDRARRITGTLEQLAPDVAPYASLLNGLLSVSIEETPVVRALDATERSERLTRLLVELIGTSVTHTPLVLMVDGLHFSDRSTIRLLELGSTEWQQGQLLVTVTYRDDLAPTFEPDPSRTVDMALGPLDRDGSDLVVHDLLGTDHVPDVLLGEIYRRARGNILVTAELVRAVGASSLLDGRAELEPRQLEELLGDLDVTDRLQRLMMARIDRLAPGPRWTLTRAAAVGSRFDMATLEALLRAERRDLGLPTALQQLVEAGLVENDSSSGNAEFAFAHEAIRDVAYDSILFRTRRVLHHDLAEHLVEVHDRDLDRAAAVIAAHYRTAGDHERAALFGVRAGDWALSSYAIDEAEHLYALAAEEFRSAGRDFTVHRSFVHERLGDCASLGGRPGDAVKRQQRALADWRRLQPDRRTRIPRQLTHGRPRAMREAELCQKIAHAHQRADHYKRALDWLDRAEATAPARAPLFHARLSALRGTTLFRLGRYDLAAEECAHAVELARRTEDRAAIAYARDMLAMTYLEQGRLREAIEQRVEAVALFEEEGDLRGSMGCHNNLGAAYQLMGALDDALAHYEQAAEAAKRLRNVQGMAIIENNIGEVLLTQGRLDAAAERFAMTVAVHDESGQAPSWAGLALVNLSRVDVRRGELERASEHLETGTKLLRQAQARGLLLEASEQRVELLLAEGQLAAAARSNERFAQDARRLGLQLYEARSALLAGRIAVREGADRRALDELRRAIELAEAVGAQREQAEAWAELAAAELDPDAADRAAALRHELGV